MPGFAHQARRRLVSRVGSCPLSLAIAGRGRWSPATLAGQVTSLVTVEASETTLIPLMKLVVLFPLHQLLHLLLKTGYRRVVSLDCIFLYAHSPEFLSLWGSLGRLLLLGDGFDAEGGVYSLCQCLWRQQSYLPSHFEVRESLQEFFTCQVVNSITVAGRIGSAYKPLYVCCQLWKRFSFFPPPRRQ